VSDPSRLGISLLFFGMFPLIDFFIRFVNSDVELFC
jgi:hypothetical protein